VIDDILLLSARYSRSEYLYIAERLFLSPGIVLQVLEQSVMQRRKSQYMGYFGISEDEHFNRERHEDERISESVSLRKVLINVDNKLSSISKEEIGSLRLGVDVWTKHYYPNMHYRQLIFDKPTSIIWFLDAMELVMVTTSDMMVTYNKEKSSWFEIIKSADNGRKLSISGDFNREFMFGNSKQTAEIPRSSSKGRIQGKERISITLDRSSIHDVHYPKRLHRLCFLLSIWINMVDS
jgi:hypothetical protein